MQEKKKLAVPKPEGKEERTSSLADSFRAVPSTPNAVRKRVAKVARQDDW